MAKGIVPKLNQQASDYISECYTELRSFESVDEDRVGPSTPKLLIQLLAF